MATKAEVEFWKDQCRKLTAALDRSLKDKHALIARIWDNSEEAKTARAVADGLEWQVEELQAENVKLRKLVQDVLPFIAEEIGLCVTSDCFMFEECCGDTSVGPCPAVGCIRRRALELGIEAPDE